MDNKDKQALIDGTATIPYKLHILNDDGSIKDTLTEEDIVSTDYEDYRYVDSSSLCIGQFVARKLKGEIKTIDKDLQIEDKEISVEMGVNRNDGSKVYDITIDGKSEQTTYAGKNLFDYISHLKATGDGLTNTINEDGSITTVGKPTKNYALIVNGYNIIDMLEDGETYTFSQVTTNNKLYLQVIAKKKDGTYFYMPLTTNIKSKSFKVDKTIYASYFIDVQTNTMAIWGDSSLTINNKYMLCKGTDTADTSFEPYVGGQPSPSPDYPQEIKSVEGIRNLFDKDGSILVGKLYNSSGSVINNSNWNIYDEFIEVESNSVYNASAKMDNSISTQLMIIEFDENKNFITRQSFSKITNKPKLIATLGDTTKYIRFSYRNDTGMYDIQLEEGSIAHDYVPYGSWLKVKNTGKNLFWEEEHGSIDESTGIDIYNSNRWRTKGYIKVNSNTSYTLSSDASNNIYYIFYYYNKDKTFIKSDTLIGKTSATSTSPSNCEYLRCVIADTASIKTTQRQLEQGSTATEYEPYKEQSTLIDMNKPNLFDKDNANILNLYPGTTFGSNNNYNSICIEIKPNTTYTLISSNHYSDGLALGTSEEYPVAGGTVTNKTSVGKTKNNVTITSGANDKYLLATI